MNPQKTRYFDISDISLLIVNLIPLFGALFLGWSLFSILIIYWLESAVIGFYTLIKMIITLTNYNKKSDLNKDNLSVLINKIKSVVAIPFFIFHYSIFMIVHLIFIFVLSGNFLASSLTLPKINEIIGILLITTASLFVSHGISLYTNFIREKEFQKTSTERLMFSAYGRIIVMHLTLLFGGFLIISTGLPKSMIVLFVILKMIIDLRAHKKEHEKLEK